MGEEFEAKLTNKGRLTLPRKIRQALGVAPGDRVACEVSDRGVMVQPVRPANVFHEIAGRWREGAGLTIEEINAWVREMRGHDEPDL